MLDYENDLFNQDFLYEFVLRSSQAELMKMFSIKHRQSDKARETMLFLKNLNINWR